MRVFLEDDPTGVRAREFCAAYDEASVWAPDSVMNPVGELIDLIKQKAAASEGVHSNELGIAFVRCIKAMRADSGFPDSSFEYRLVKF